MSIKSTKSLYFYTCIYKSLGCSNLFLCLFILFFFAFRWTLTFDNMFEKDVRFSFFNSRWHVAFRSQVTGVPSWKSSGIIFSILFILHEGIPHSWISRDVFHWRSRDYRLWKSHFLWTPSAAVLDCLSLRSLTGANWPSKIGNVQKIKRFTLSMKNSYNNCH